MTIKPEDIATLVELFETSQWDELHVEIDGLHLFLSTDPNARLTSGPAAHPVVVASVAASPAVAVPGTASTLPRTGGGAVEAEAVPSHWIPVAAPNLGTFYRSPKPGAAPYVEVGGAVEETTEVCLLEVMKLFTAVRAGTKGVIRRICVADAEMVEYAQVLFYVEPA